MQIFSEDVVVPSNSNKGENSVIETGYLVEFI